jgi:ubiquinone/menaquinone biosynthesis C-methylase UbiE
LILDGVPESEQRATYQFGQDEAMHRILDMRSAERDAAYLLPYLEPGQRLLDCGCGPGQITVGLARAVDPGRVTGIDLDAAVLDQARRRAADAGVGNIEFQEASAVALPFPDESFDVVHFHAILCHLPSPQDALAEARRVLKRGGFVAVSEPDIPSFQIATDDPAALRVIDFLAAGTRAAGGDPSLARRLRPLLHEAGFSPTVGSMSGLSFGDPKSAPEKAAAWAGLASGSTLAANTIAEGSFSAAELDQTAAALREYARRPDAMIAEFWGEALGWKDGPAGVWARPRPS